MNMATLPDQVAGTTRVVLTSRDHAILCGIAVQGVVTQHAYLRLLSEKLDATLVGRAGELPPGTVHLGSHVRYRIDGGKLLEHRLVIGPRDEIAGKTCSLRSLHGLALLGMREGERALSGQGERVRLRLRLIRWSQRGRRLLLGQGDATRLSSDPQSRDRLQIPNSLSRLLCLPTWWTRHSLSFRDKRESAGM